MATSNHDADCLAPQTAKTHVDAPKRKKLHLCCLLLTLSIYLLAATIAVAATRQCDKQFDWRPPNGNASENVTVDVCGMLKTYPQYYGPPLLVLAVIGYAFNCAQCSLRNLFRNKMKASVAYAHVQRLLNAEPSVAWRATAYHTEMRTKFVLSFAHTTVMRQKVNVMDRVNTASRISHFDYSKYGYSDRSKLVCSTCNQSNLGELAQQKKHSIVQLNIVKKLAFEGSADRECDRQRTQFYDNLQGLDQHVEIAQVFQIEGKTAESESLTICADDCPFYMNAVAYYIFSGLGLSWPYRVLIDSVLHRVDFQVVKVFGKSPCSNEPDSRAQDSLNGATTSAVEKQAVSVDLSV